MNVVRARGLTRTFGRKQALTGLDLDVAAGEVYGLLGLNGAGKSTAIRILTGLAPPDAGEAFVDGVDVVASPRDVVGRIGVVFETNLATEPGWSLARYLRFFGRVHGLDDATTSERSRALVTTLGLGEHAERPIRTLSGGNRRKVELARALLHRPKVLFLDEPTRELDIPSKRATWRALKALTADGTTIFISSHDAQEIATMCTRVGVLREGLLSWEGPIASLTSEGSIVDALSAALEGTELPAPAPAPVTAPAPQATAPVRPVPPRTTEFTIVRREPPKG